MEGGKSNANGNKPVILINQRKRKKKEGKKVVSV